MEFIEGAARLKGNAKALVAEPHMLEQHKCSFSQGHLALRDEARGWRPCRPKSLK